MYMSKRQLPPPPSPSPPRRAHDTASGSYSYDIQTWYDYDAEGLDPNTCNSCSDEWKGDGECDRRCNKAACGWDGDDCFHDNSGCYTSPTALDYRGTVNHTKYGLPCQYWSDQWPNTHTYTSAAWPDAGLGGHNFCRRPDPTDDTKGPWCLTASLDEVWQYCDVGEGCRPPQPPSPPPPSPPRHPPLQPPPPPPVCPDACAASLSNGRCEPECNTTACLWDRGDCMDLVAMLLREAGIASPRGGRWVMSNLTHGLAYAALPPPPPQGRARSIGSGEDAAASGGGASPAIVGVVLAALLVFAAVGLWRRYRVRASGGLLAAVMRRRNGRPLRGHELQAEPNAPELEPVVAVFVPPPD